MIYKRPSTPHPLYRKKGLCIYEKVEQNESESVPPSILGLAVARGWVVISSPRAQSYALIGRLWESKQLLLRQRWWLARTRCAAIVLLRRLWSRFKRGAWARRLLYSYSWHKANSQRSSLARTCPELQPDRKILEWVEFLLAIELVVSRLLTWTPHAITLALHCRRTVPRRDKPGSPYQ